MKIVTNYMPLLLSLLLYILLWNILYPYLCYNLDSDCVSYLTIAEKVAEGDFYRGVNGLWSPLNSWILAPFIKWGYNAWETAMHLNFSFGFVVILLVHLLLKKIKVASFGYRVFIVFTGILLSYFVYVQMFGDVLQLIFLLLYFLLLQKIIQNPNNYFLVLLTGVVAAIAFFAKAYSFFFYVLHFGFVSLWMYFTKHSNKWILFRNYIIGVSICLLLMLPWSIAMHKKYHQFSLSGFAGKLNMSWYINSSKTFKPEYNILIPPPYADSPTFWEDPFFSQDKLSSPFTSVSHFTKWIARVIHTCIVAISCFNEISFLSMAIVIAWLLLFVQKKSQKNIYYHEDMEWLVLSAILLPLGYLTIHIETRYIWFNTFIIMILACNLVSLLHLNKFLKNTLIVIVAISFIVFPLFHIEILRNKNKDLFETASILNSNNITGNFTSDEIDDGKMWVIAYLNKSRYFTIENSSIEWSQLISEMKKYQVKYFFKKNEKLSNQVELNGFQYVMKAGKYDVYQLQN